MNISGVRAELCKNGYAVLPGFFDEEELDQLRYEAEYVLEASGTYDHGDNESIAASRGCVFEVVRPAYSRSPAASAAPRCSGREGAWGHNAVLAGGGLAAAAPAAPAAHMDTLQAGSSAMRLPGLGLMGCAKLHALVCAALGFPLEVLSQPHLRSGAGSGPGAGAGAGAAGFGTPVAGAGDSCSKDADGAEQAAADQVAHGGIAATPDGHACAAVAPGEAAATGGGRHPAVAIARGAACRAGCGCGSGGGGGNVLPRPPSDTSCAQQVASAVAAGSVSNTGTCSGDGRTCGCSCSSRNNGEGSSSIGIDSSDSGSSGGGPYLFNEQFIIKPPRSSARCAFGWHRDSDWCRGRPEFQYSPYISVWAALDDMDAENGALAVVPRSHVAPAPPAAAAAPVAGVQRGGAGTDAGACALAGAAPSAATAAAAPHQLLLVPAGTVVVFLDTLLHASGPNTSRHMRRAWMPQFSAEPILRCRQAPPQHQQQELRLLQEPQQTPHRSESLEAQQHLQARARHQPHPHGLAAGVLAPDAMRGGRGRPQQQPAALPVALAVPLRALAGVS